MELNNIIVDMKVKAKNFEAVDYRIVNRWAYDIEKSMYECPYCGNEIFRTDKFCSNCGNRIL